MRQTKTPTTLLIESLAFGGSGIARHEGKVWFVPFTIPGERVTALAVRSKKSFVQARLIKVLEASPHRVEAACQHFANCGGCSYQHIQYEEQLRWKATQVKDAFQRIGKIHNLPPITSIAAPAPLHYRNRIQLRIHNGKACFADTTARGLVPIRRCEIASEAINEKLSRLQKRYLGGEQLTLRERPGRKGFYQTNDSVAELLLQEVEKFLKNSPAKRLIDAYCGGGAFSKKFRNCFDSILGIDWSEAAIESAKNDAQENETYICSSVSEALQDHLSDTDIPTELILDPPREGLDSSLIPILLNASDTSITYVSCNPATLARDCALLQEKFRIEALSVLDMFPQTASIECVIRLI